MALGTTIQNAHEGQDYQTDLNISSQDLQLVNSVAKARPDLPIVVVFFTGNALDISPLLAHPNVGAILYVGQPSVNSNGIADVLFGKVVPAGRTVTTIYPFEFGLSLSVFDMGVRPGPSDHARPDCPMSQWGQSPPLSQ